MFPMAQVSDYKIISDPNKSIVESAVKMALEDGFVIYGTPSVAYDPEAQAVVFSQSMIKVSPHE